jgi:2-succinyl-5-enolpyruvyl-6-hydroxy-3-cyclohexene-1-carboxylate synthase
MSLAMNNAAWGRAIVAHLERLGAGRFFLSPGARSVALAAALSDRGSEVTVHYDERGLGFAALGWAMATGRLAVCVTTSGSAVANLLPACVEAAHSGVPLVFLTADRPPELRGTGANQTIEQPGLFGSFVRAAVDLPCPEEPAAGSRLEALLLEAVAAALGDAPGPVHVNVPLREPLLTPEPTGDCPMGKIRAQESHDPEEMSEGFDFQNFAGGPGVVVLGRLAAQEQPAAEQAIALAGRLGWPVIADALSGGRLRPGVVRHADWILHRGDVPRPRRVLHFGGSLVSKRVGQWLSACRGSDCVQVRRGPERLDPWNQNPVRIRAGVAAFCMQAARQVERREKETPWLEGDAAVGRALAKRLDAGDALTEPGVAREVARACGAGGSAVFLGNSMPVRDFDSCVDAVTERPVCVFGNRGASGIDGNIATMAGVAMGAKIPVIGILGDLTVLHDMNSLPLLRGLPVTLVVINNGGGGIFRFLSLPVDESLIEAPHGWDFEKVAAQFGLEYHRLVTRHALATHLRERPTGPRVLECPTDRAANHALHVELREICQRLEVPWGA